MSEGPARAALTIQAFFAHQEAIRRVLRRRLGSAEAAADAMQELYLKLCFSTPGPEIENPRAFVLRAANNLAIDQGRGQSRRARLHDAAASEIETIEQRTPERAALARAELAYLADAVATLPPRARRVFWLKRFEGRSHAEIAAALGIGLTTVFKDLKLTMSTLLAARRRFRGEEEGGDGERAAEEGGDK
ncbi:MAG: RNA polymerase sigma factor [Pseudomonadota bacterium]